MNIGLRAKSALALLVCIGVALALSLFAGWRAVLGIEENLGASFARNFTQYNEQRVLAPVLRELALSQRLAESEVSRRWLRDENNSQKKALFFAEAAHYQKAFTDRSYFLISNKTRHYYFNDRKSRLSDKPRYSLNPQDKNDAWFFKTMRDLKTDGVHGFNINVNVDVKLKVTKVWFNVLVNDGNQKLGLAGTGLDLTTVLDHFLKSAETGVTPILINNAGAIQAHPNKKLINFDSVGAAKYSRTIFGLLNSVDARALKAAMDSARIEDEKIQLLHATLDGRQQIIALSYVPELGWYVMTAVDLQAARVLDKELLLPLLLGGIVMVVLLLAAITFAVNRLLLTPVIRLTASARELGKGNYDAPLPPASGDELGELTRAFGTMASQVRSYTENLESKIQERTRELTEVNHQMEIANKNIGDSIQYASLIQNAILPERDLTATPGLDYFVWWQPRDIVGGDLYIFRTEEKGYLIGVVDCSGHGVPGALMTMIAHATIHIVIDEMGAKNPAEILHQSDVRLRNTLRASDESNRLATHMDAGLCYVDLEAKTVIYAGAKTSLYWSDGKNGGELKGDRLVLGGKREALFHNQTLPLKGKSFYLTTDGVLDQSGGESGYGFGNERFSSLIGRISKLPFETQRENFIRELESYQDGRPQRDDITIIGFGSKEI
jgi:sigma-B regulation protein RsbU (phosphoserine phosphatase)